MQIKRTQGSVGRTAQGVDILFDESCKDWLSRVQPYNDLNQIDHTTGAIIKSMEIVSTDGSYIAYGPRRLSFLSDGRVLMSAGKDGSPMLYILDKENAKATPLGKFQGLANVVYDLASRFTPEFNKPISKLDSKKEAKKLKNKANEVGDMIEYTIKVRNGVANSVITDLTDQDQLPNGLEYVLGTIKVDEKAVTDAKDKDNG